MKALAFSNNDLAIVAWTFDTKLRNCVGFAIYRHDMQSGVEQVLPAMARFQGQTGTGLTTEQAPVQKFWWKDLYARRGGVYRYRIVPLAGTIGALKPMAGVAPLVSNVVTITHARGKFSSFFNRGILATQAVARALGQPPSQQKLVRRISDVNDDLRKRLMGEIFDGLTALLSRSDASGGNSDILSALYELNDPEGLEVRLHGADKSLGRTRSVVLGNEVTAAKKGTPAVMDVYSQNRQKLKDAGATVIDRFLNPGQIPHNKFVVLRTGGKPQAVVMGSTNWTMNALAAQTNNALIIDSPAVAQAYEDYWTRLQDDTDAAHGDPKQLQSKDFRSANAAHNAQSIAKPIALEDGSGEVEVFFSPNMPTLLPKKPNMPGDMGRVFELIKNAKQAVLFLAFDPGNNSILDAAGKAQKANPDLFVRGALTSAPRASNFAIAAGAAGDKTAAKTPSSVQVVGEAGGARKKGQKPTKGTKAPGPISSHAVPAGAVTKDDAFGAWQAELLKAGFAIIHDKIVVIDPFSDDCVVVCGSHNLGYRASHNNDENMVIVRGHRGLAEAYACHVLDVYDHYAWRYWLSKMPDTFGKPLEANDAWQDRYILNKQVKSAEMRFWMAAVPTTELKPSATIKTSDIVPDGATPPPAAAPGAAVAVPPAAPPAAKPKRKAPVKKKAPAKKKAPIKKAKRKT
jgi:phosphatidylserine/phosphatidylglycerophosphate/cardiolipin synthase-like enzyme